MKKTNEQLRLIRECFIPGALGELNEACMWLGRAIDDSVSVSVSSDPGAVKGHPAYKAFVAIGIPALAWLKDILGNKYVEPDWWKLTAADEILAAHGIPHEIPMELSGRLAPQAGHLHRFLKKEFGKGGSLYTYTVYPNDCACGKKGEWIADGVSRFGFYCKKCSEKALEEA